MDYTSPLGLYASVQKSTQVQHTRGPKSRIPEVSTANGHGVSSRPALAHRHVGAAQQTGDASGQSEDVHLALVLAATSPSCDALCTSTTL